MSDEAMTAKQFAEGIRNMKFGDVMTVVTAINQSTGTKAKKIDGQTLILAADLISKDQVGLPAKATREPAPAKSKGAAAA